MEKTTITKREMYEQIILMFTEGTEDNEIIATAEDVIAFCGKEIEALDKKAAKAKERAAAQKAEGDELTDAVLAVLTDEFQPAGDIVKALNREDVTTHKVSYRLRVLVEGGKAVKEQINIAAEGEKKHLVMGYKLA